MNSPRLGHGPLLEVADPSLQLPDGVEPLLGNSALIWI